MMALLRRLGFLLALLLVFVYLTFPFCWAIVTSLKDKNQLFMTPATLLPVSPENAAISLYGGNFSYVFFGNKMFFRGMANSLFVALSVTLASLLLGSFAAFSFAKLRFRGRDFGLYLILSLTLFPQITLLSGLYKIMSFLKMSPYANMIITYMIFALPFTVWVLTRFIRDLPSSLLESARIDGAGFSAVLFKIFFPLLAPALVTTGLLGFIAAWNEYLFALIFTLTDEIAQTVPVVIARFSGSYAFEEPYGEIMAAAITVTIPLILLVLIFQKKIVSGLTAGSEKG